MEGNRSENVCGVLEGGSRLEFTKRHVRASDTQTAAVCCAEKEQNIPLNLLETLSVFFLPHSCGVLDVPLLH